MSSFSITGVYINSSIYEDTVECGNVLEEQMIF